MVRAIQKTLYLVLACFIGLFIASSFFIRAKYNYFVYGDTPVLEKQQLGLFILGIVVVLALSVILYKTCLKLNQYSWKIVIPATLLCSFAIQIVIIFLFPRLPTDDSQTVLRLFPDNYLVIKVLNILFTLLTSLMIYLLYKELNDKSKDHDYGILVFAATYIPSLFMSNLIYNDVIATAFLTSALYFAVKFIKRKSIKDIVFAAIFLAVGNYFRSIGVIFLIAVVVSLLFNMRAIGVKKALSALFITALLFNVPGWMQNAVLQATNVVDEPINENSAPVYMWLNMGINLETFGFWDNWQSYTIYQQDANYNKAESTQLFKEEISHKLSEASLRDIVKMYYKKIVWTWTEGTYQIERYGLGNDGSSSNGGRMSFVMDRYSCTNAATDLFKADSKYRSGMLWLLYVLNFLMYVCILIRLIRGIRAKRYEETSLILVVLGFIGFYLLWEIKSRYIYPVYPLLIVLSYMGFKDVYDYMLKRYFPR